MGSQRAEAMPKKAKDIRRSTTAVVFDSLLKSLVPQSKEFWRKIRPHWSFSNQLSQKEKEMSNDVCHPVLGWNSALTRKKNKKIEPKKH